MIIKPWTDLPPPRHTLNEQLEEEDPSVPARDIVIPKIDVELLLNNELQAVDYLLVLPQRLDRIVLGLSANDKIEKIGKIKIEYVLSKPSSIKVTEEEKEEEEEEYNEDEQLYLVGTAKQLDLKPVEIIINKVKINEKTYLNYIILPVFKELITYNLLAKAVLTKIASSFKKLITISINNNVESVKLLLSANFSPTLNGENSLLNKRQNSSLTLLEPPFFASSGISSFISSNLCSIHRQNINFIVNDTDESVLELCSILSKTILIKDHKAYMARCYKNCTHISNSLYI